MGTPPRKYNKRKPNNRGNNRDNNRPKQTSPPAANSSSEPSMETACFSAGMMAVVTYVLGLIGSILLKSKTEIAQSWANTFFFFAIISALSGLLFAIMLSRVIEQTSSSQKWKLSLAIYPSLTYLLFEGFMRYMPYAHYYSLPALGIAFSLGILGMLILKT